jgi:uncharacterized membrane protein
MENINLAGQPVQNTNPSPAPAQSNQSQSQPQQAQEVQPKPNKSVNMPPSEEVIFAVLSYIPFLNIVIFILKDDNDLIKFHARQGMIIFFIYVLGFLPLPFIDTAFLIVAVIATLVGASKAYKLEKYRLPIIYDLSTKLPF